MDADKLAISTTTDGKPPREGHETDGAPAPMKSNGQYEAYWILTPEERAKGFIRPVRNSYKHVGVRPQNPHRLRDLTAEEHERYDQFSYVKYEAYSCSRIVDPNGPTPECGYPSDNERHDAESESFLHHFESRNGSSVTGRYWTEKQLHSGCGSVTSMSRDIAETYARRPTDYYGSTMCVRCGVHLPVGEFGEFEWLDGQKVGT